MKNIALFDVDDTLREGVSDWKYDGPLGKLLFPDCDILVQFFTEVVSTPEGRQLNRRAWIAMALKHAGYEYTQEYLDDLTYEFGWHVEESMIAQTGLVEGVPDMLEDLKGKGWYLYAVSSASHANTHAALEHDCISDVFDGIYGHGWGSSSDQNGLGKADAVKDILQRHKTANFAGTRSFVVGDGESDMKLAQAFDIPFFAIPTRWNGWRETKPEYFRSVMIEKVTNLLGLV